jgi:hypothetical protein
MVNECLVLGKIYDVQFTIYDFFKCHIENRLNECLLQERFTMRDFFKSQIVPRKS